MPGIVTRKSAHLRETILVPGNRSISGYLYLPENRYLRKNIFEYIFENILGVYSGAKVGTIDLWKKPYIKNLMLVKWTFKECDFFYNKYFYLGTKIFIAKLYLFSIEILLISCCKKAKVTSWPPAWGCHSVGAWPGWAWAWPPPPPPLQTPTSPLSSFYTPLWNSSFNHNNNKEEQITRKN